MVVGSTRELNTRLIHAAKNAKRISEFAAAVVILPAASNSFFGKKALLKDLEVLPLWLRRLESFGAVATVEIELKLDANIGADIMAGVGGVTRATGGV
ncbi:hypothetical protein SLEP1_g51505 [Rubroshorea leprosula]|uniref:Uncharacterized protein n=1 Tax=Rubroshorea leprosula TaxID=152421 RepID=A0AAV5M5X6_9ROSI|nr:hypothetical protein SLEP1_g51505 [Rubroshorea leprosula]